MNNYYLFIHEGENIDIIPIQNGMDNQTIKIIFSREVAKHNLPKVFSILSI